MVSAEFKNYKEMIELIPTIRKVVKKGIQLESNDHVHDEKRIQQELEFFKNGLLIFQTKWTIDIIYIIYMRKSLYFNELKKTLRGISSRILTDRLNLLEKRRIINREVHNVKPIRVSYKMTEYGEGIYELLLPLLFYSVLPKKK